MCNVSGRMRVLMVVGLAAGLFSGSTACYRLSFRPRDIKNVRRQFHVPASVEIISFDSSPKTAGFFGREGLWISAIFHFSEKQFDGYLERLADPSVWKPVSLLGYSPKRADRYSEKALSWQDLPLPVWPQRFLSHWDLWDEARGVVSGKYFCSVIMGMQGEKMNHPDGSFHYKWGYRGLHCTEIENEPGTVAALGVLDFKLKKLYVFLRFSG